jgi:hypothetical protein
MTQFFLGGRLPAQEPGDARHHPCQQNDSNQTKREKVHGFSCLSV